VPNKASQCTHVAFASLCFGSFRRKRLRSFTTGLVNPNGTRPVPSENSILGKIGKVRERWRANHSGFRSMMASFGSRRVTS
jgi:hypothetical protein